MSNVTLDGTGVNDDRQSLYDEIGQFVGVPRYFMDNGKHLTLNAKWLYVTLLSFKNQKTKKTFPAYPAIMEQSGLSRQAVAAALKELEHFHWITKKRNFSRASDYHLTCPVHGSERQRLLWPTKEAQKAYQYQLREEREGKEAWNRARGAFNMWEAYQRGEIQITKALPDSVESSEVEDKEFERVPF